MSEFLEPNTQEYQIIQVALELAFEAGKWAGQVELEEHYDRSQYAVAMLEHAYSRKNAMPLKPASHHRTVTVNLRSDVWREGVRKSSKEYVDKAMSFVVQNLKISYHNGKPTQPTHQ
jgi:hypothetical protein